MRSVRLLVSVRDANEARAAMDGGAAIIDAKDPARGALGAVERPVLRAIRDVVGDTRPLSAALGDADDDAAIADAARNAAELGCAYVKVGFRGVRDPERARALLAGAVHGAGAGRAVVAHAGAPATASRTQVIAVAYADAEHVDALPPHRLIDVASRAGATGVLLDTAVKAGGSVFELIAPSDIARWVEAAHDASLLVAVAGKLQRDDLALVAALGADVAGVRGAACDGGREGCVTMARVRALADVIQRERDRCVHVAPSRITASSSAPQESGCPVARGHAIPSAFDLR